MNMQEHILAALKEQFTRWDGLLAGMSDAQHSAPHLPSDWSTKDELAHLWAWQQRSIARLETAHTLRPPAYPAWPPELDPEVEDVDQVNAWIFESNRALPWPQMYERWRAGYLRFIELGASVSEMELLDMGRYPWLEGRSLASTLLASYDHHQEHYDKLLAWLKEANA